jgi:hypothetical protein
VTTETGAWFTEHDVIADRIASLAGSAATAEFPFVVPDDQPAGEIIGEFVDRCLAEERAVTASLVARGSRVLTSAGLVVIILLGLVAITPKTVSGSAAALLGLGLGLMLVSAALGIVCASPKRTIDIDPASVEAKLTDQAWRAKSELARRTVARSQLKVWMSVRALNSRLNRWLRVAVTIHVVGLGAACAAAWVMLIG